MKNDLLASGNILIIFAHLDDEFAIAPLIKLLTKNRFSITVLFCAERLDNSHKQREIRRKESCKSMQSMGVHESRIIYLNNYFPVEDCRLYKASKEIYFFIDDLCINNDVKKILTLAYEGGNPDHDCLAILVDKYCSNRNILPFFFPAYNYQHNMLFPFSVLKPLKTQTTFCRHFEIKYFSWFSSLRIAFIYKSEVLAFLKIIPFLIIKTFFSKKIHYFNILILNSVNWEKSLSLNRYNVELNNILKEISII